MNYLKDLENLRKKILIKKIISFLFITFFICIIFFSNEEISEFDIISEFGIFSLIIINVITSKNTREYKKIYKKNIIMEAFKSIFTNINYDLESGLPQSTISNTNMMDTGDLYRSNDYISAKYKNINFECADVDIEEAYTDSDGDVQYSTIFEGQWLIFDFNKKFKANIQICEKSFKGAKRGGLFSDENYKKIEMEDVDFNKIFKVYAENELDAFYVLTPNIMEKIKELNNKLDGNLLFCFVNSKLHVGLHNRKDLFEPSVYKKIDLESEKEKVLNEIKTITDFVDILDLDNDLFRR